LVDLRIEDRRDTIVAFLTLLGVMSAHSILETARDTLFLTHLPARELPWAYMAIAGLALLATSVHRATLEWFSRRRALAASLGVGAVVTLAFFPLADTKAPWVLFALYVWTGVLTTVAVIQFWLLAAQVFDVGQAKRTFYIVAAGGLVGAALGSAAAGVVLTWLAPPYLLIASAIMLVMTAGVALAFPRPRAVGSPRRNRWKRIRPTVVQVGKDPYLRRLFGSITLAAMVFTCVDFVFKTMVSVDVSPEQLGPFFARFYALTNGVALFVQLVVAPRVLRAAGVSGSLWLLPALVLAGSVGFVLTLGLGAVLALRVADGALRHSLHRTSVEILYLPLPPEVRDGFKALADVLGHRGGQALASLGLIGAVALGARSEHVAAAVGVLALLWLGTLRGVRPHYLELFRRNLREGALSTHLEVPVLDLHSLEALIGALSSENDSEVVGAMDVLASFGRTNLIPALILHHPSAAVVLRAFELFTHTPRADVARLAPRLLEHEDPRVRAAAVRIRSEAGSDTGILDVLRNDDTPVVRATVLVHRIRAGNLDEWQGGDALRSIIDGSSSAMRLGLALAARDLPSGRYTWALVRLAGIREPGLAVEVVRSMAAAPDVEFLPTLVRLLADRECRETARAAVVALGEPAIDVLAAHLSDERLPRRVRRHLPRTLARLEVDRAADVMVDRLMREQDPIIVREILRGLERMRERISITNVQRSKLLSIAEATLRRGIRILAWRVVLDLSLGGTHAQTHAAELLSALLGDLEASEVERIFRILHIIAPREEFRIMHASLRGTDPSAREDSRELLSNVVPESLRSGLLALVDDSPDGVRLESAAAFWGPPDLQIIARALAELDGASGADRGRAPGHLARVHIEHLSAMTGDPNETLRSVALYRLQELGKGPGLRGELSEAGAIGIARDDRALLGEGEAGAARGE
jgi:ATP:ADP antiporter, AAA family